ncbi:MAG TPA: AI-2E family transporter [Acidimicrobiales bacterium]|nr:AI-2E family transporter [Acidimicrobiales bacterium]
MPLRRRRGAGRGAPSLRGRLTSTGPGPEGRVQDRPSTPAPVSSRSSGAAPGRHRPSPTTEAPAGAAVPPFLVTTAGWLWRLLVVAVAGWLAIAAARRLLLLLAPVAVAIVLTALLKPLADRLRRRGLPASVAALAVLARALLFVGGFVAVLTPRFLQEIDQVGPAVGDALATAETWLVDGPLDLEPSRVNDLRQRVTELASPGTGNSSGALTSAILATEVVAGAVLSLVFAFFFIRDGDLLIGWVVDQLDDRLRAPARRMGRAAWATLAGYLRGLTVLAGFNAVATAIGLAVIGVPLFLSLAVVEFFFSFVPIVGSIAAGALAATVALSFGGLADALLVVALAVAIDLVEGNVFHPVVIGRSVGLHPVVVLAALTAGGALFGIVGLLVAVPLTAVVVAAAGQLQHWRRDRH